MYSGEIYSQDKILSAVHAGRTKCCLAALDYARQRRARDYRRPVGRGRRVAVGLDIAPGEDLSARSANIAPRLQERSVVVGGTYLISAASFVASTARSAVSYAPRVVPGVVRAGGTPAAFAMPQVQLIGSR